MGVLLLCLKQKYLREEDKRRQNARTDDVVLNMANVYEENSMTGDDVEPMANPMHYTTPEEVTSSSPSSGHFEPTPTSATAPSESAAATADEGALRQQLVEMCDEMREMDCRIEELEQRKRQLALRRLQRRQHAPPVDDMPDI